MSPKFSDKCLYKRHTEDRHRGKDRQGSRRQREGGGRLGKCSQKNADHHQKLEEGKEWNLPESLWKDLGPANTMNLEFFSPELREDKYLLF